MDQENGLEPELFVGVIFDLSMRGVSGTRSFDVVSGVIKSAGIALDGKIFVGHPDNQLMPRRSGGVTAALANYRECRVDHAIRQTIQIVGSQDRDARRIILIVTDRFTAEFKYRFEKANQLNAQRGGDCEIHFVGIGDKYDARLFSSLCSRAAHCQVHHLDTAAAFSDLFQSIVGFDARPKSLPNPASDERSVPNGSV